MEQKLILNNLKQIFRTTLLFLFLTTFYSQHVMAQDLCKPVGWATQGNGVTGGGNATPVVVSNYNDLKSALTNGSVKVVHVQGTITFPSNGRINVQDQSGKTIFGLPGSKIVSTDMTSSGSGLLYVKRMDNLIIRNMYFEGPGAYDNDGNDNLTVDDSRNVWVDHCEFHDGMDGNFDIKNKSDLISVTWCTFSYEKPPKAGGSGGAPDHRYTNLIGSSDGATADRGKLRVTFQYCWWGEGCRERMPRVRFGKVHLVNNYYSSSVANQGVRAGFEADIRVEGNYFISGYSKPIDEFDKDYTAIYAKNNTGASDMTKNTAFTPPYTIDIASASSIVTPIKNCAGATLSSPTACSSCGGGVVNPGNNSPSVSITSPSNNQQFATAPTTITINANASHSDGTVSNVEFYNGATLLGTDNSSPYSYTWSNVVAGTYTITAKAKDDKGAITTSSAITLIVGDGGNSGQPATLNKRGSGSSTQTVAVGEAIAGFYYEWTNATTVNVTGIPTGIQTTINNSAKTVTFSGASTQSGTFSYTITTVGGNPEASKTGTITVTGNASNQSPSISLTSPINNQSYTSPAIVNLAASASDSDGSITKVDFYNGSTLIGSDNSSPYSYTWSNVVANTYTITAKATDDKGAVTTSSAITITVTNAQTTDCNGIVGGSAYLDDCAKCVGGNTGATACTPTCANSEVKFGQIGYSTMAGGTTGGAGGDEVTVSTGTQLQDAIKNATGPRIIYIDGKITVANSTGLSKIDIKDVSNISIIGVADRGEIEGIGLKIWRASNIIVQNLKIHHVLTGDKDCLTIDGPSDHIWVDHCEIYNDYDGVDKEYYDALLDLKNDVDYVTISWNYFHDSWKCSLSGSSESDNYNRTVTYHHNYYRNINSRLPLFRSGYAHIFNNFYKDIHETTINSRMNACVKIENNYFLDANNPYITAYSDVDGYGDISGNILVNSPFVYTSDERELMACSASIPYSYSANLNCADVINTIVPQYSGVNKSLNVSYDCSGLANGTASIDDCGVCSGGNTGVTPNACPKDCNGDANGTAAVDACGVCSGGATGIPIDNCNVDCNGVTDGTATLDACGVCVGGNTGFTACSGEIEGETACSVDGILLENTNAGFKGDGYVNTDNISGASVSWVLNSNSAQTATISFRFANGGTGARSGNISINGISLGEATFPTTGAWTTWDIFSINLNLVAGANELIITATGMEGLANIDIVYFSEGVTDAMCIVTNIQSTINSQIQVYPNPTQNIVQLSEEVAWAVYNSLGEELSRGIGTTLDLTAQTSGVYFLKLDDRVVKLVKE